MPKKDKRSKKTAPAETKKKRKIVWYAKGGDIMRAGPFPDQVRAAASMTLLAQPRRYIPHTGETLPEVREGSKPDNFATWPEYEDA